MKLDLQSKDLDVAKCVENVGGSQFELVLIAATRAREIANQRNFAQRGNPQLKYPIKVTTQALDDIEKGTVGREYLEKLQSHK